jgi:hypothetical protein
MKDEFFGHSFKRPAENELTYINNEHSLKISTRNDLNTKVYDIACGDDIIETFNTISDAVAYITTKSNHLF